MNSKNASFKLFRHNENYKNMVCEKVFNKKKIRLCKKIRTLKKTYKDIVRFRSKIIGH